MFRNNHSLKRKDKEKNTKNGNEKVSPLISKLTHDCVIKVLKKKHA